VIRWKRANDGFVESRDGRWRISPLYWGCTRPQMFELFRDGKSVATYCSTQREAKEAAERLVRLSEKP
jgi:hypothetical protein